MLMTGAAMRGTRCRAQQRSPDIFGYASFYGWSEDKSRQATQPEGQGFPGFLRSRGFTLD